MVGLGFETEGFVQVQMPDAPAAFGQDAARPALLDEGVDAIGIARMTDVHSQSETCGADFVHEGRVGYQAAAHVLDGQADAQVLGLVEQFRDGLAGLVVRAEVRHDDGRAGLLGEPDLILCLLP